MTGLCDPEYFGKKCGCDINAIVAVNTAAGRPFCMPSNRLNLAFGGRKNGKREGKKNKSD